MSNLGPMGRQRQPGLPTPPRGEPIARYDTYLEAQRVVDFLSDNHFPVQFVTIVGSGLRMVERVTGRLTYGRVAIAGAASGAWFGLFVGLLLTLFGSNYPAGFVIASMLIGSAFGMLFGVISYALTGGRRDFTSTSQIVASEYEVLCMPEHARAAIELLHTMPDGAGRDRLGRQPGGRSGSPWGSVTDPVSGPGAEARPSDPYGPPPSGSPSPGPGPGEPGGPPAPHGWRPTSTPSATSEQPGPAGEQPAPVPPDPDPAATLTYGQVMEQRRREARERAEREAREHADREGSDRNPTSP